MIEIVKDPLEVVFRSSLVEPGTHLVIQKLVGYRYDYSDEPHEETFTSGTFSQYRNSWFTGIALAGELLIDEGIIPRKTPYRHRLRRFMKRYTNRENFMNTRRTRNEVKNGNYMLDLMLDHLYPQHIYFNQVSSIRKFHLNEHHLGNYRFKLLSA